VKKAKPSELVRLSLFNKNVVVCMTSIGLHFAECDGPHPRQKASVVCRLGLDRRMPGRAERNLVFLC